MTYDITTKQKEAHVIVTFRIHSLFRGGTSAWEVDGVDDVVHERERSRGVNAKGLRAQKNVYEVYIKRRWRSHASASPERGTGSPQGYSKAKRVTLYTYCRSRCVLNHFGSCTWLFVSYMRMLLHMYALRHFLCVIAQVNTNQRWPSTANTSTIPHLRAAVIWCLGRKHGMGTINNTWYLLNRGCI